MPDKQNFTNDEIENLKLLEALLFAAPGLTSVEQLSSAMALSKKDVEKLINSLTEKLEDESGIRLQKIKNQYQLISAPDFGDAVDRFLGLEVTTRLTQAALEALAIIAYKQPATRPDVERIRGVNSDTVIKSLLAKGMIEELGRSESPGRPILYGVTPEFLLHFGLESTDQLPEVDFDEILLPDGETENQEQRLLKD